MPQVFLGAGAVFFALVKIGELENLFQPNGSRGEMPNEGDVRYAQLSEHRGEEVYYVKRVPK